VALANEALPHFFVLIDFVAAFCKPDSRIAVQGFELVHKAPQSPRPSLLKKVSEKVNNLIGTGEGIVDLRITEELRQFVRIGSLLT
jgi:hypothetical protein